MGPTKELSAAEVSRVRGVQKEGLEDVAAAVARLAWARRSEGDRQAVVDAVLREVEDHARRLTAAAHA